MTEVSYTQSDDAWQKFEDYLEARMRKHSAKNIRDIGGGANPVLSADYIATNGISYSIHDNQSNTVLLSICRLRYLLHGSIR